MDTKDYNHRIADLSDDDKPREKALKYGVDKLSTTELIAITLGSGLPGKSVIDLSREILQSCNNDVETLARMSIKEISRKFKGIGPAKAVSLMAAIELGKRCSSLKPGELPQIRTSQDVYDYVRGEIVHLNHEEFRILMLNRANRVKSCEVISSGGTAGTVVDVKIVLKKAIDALADGIILVHNHPSGTLRPSIEDDRLTTKIKNGAESLDIRVLDHVIVTSAGFYSYLDEGRI